MSAKTRWNTPPAGWTSPKAIGIDYGTGGDDYKIFDDNKIKKKGYAYIRYPYDSYKGQQLLYNALHPFRTDAGKFKISTASGTFNNNYHHPLFTGMSQQVGEPDETLDSNSSKYVFELPFYTLLDKGDFKYSSSLTSEIQSFTSTDTTTSLEAPLKPHQLAKSFHLLKHQEGKFIAEEQDAEIVYQVSLKNSADVLQEGSESLADKKNLASLTNAVESTAETEQEHYTITNDTQSDFEAGESEDVNTATLFGYLEKQTKQDKIEVDNAIATGTSMSTFKFLPKNTEQDVSSGVLVETQMSSANAENIYDTEGSS